MGKRLTASAAALWLAMGALAAGWADGNSSSSSSRSRADSATGVHYALTDGVHVCVTQFDTGGWIEDDYGSRGTCHPPARVLNAVICEMMDGATHTKHRQTC